MLHKQSIEIIGVPLDLGASRRGTDAGPSALRVAGLGKSLERMGHSISRESDVAVPSREASEPGKESIRFKSEILVACQSLAEKTKAALTRGDTPLVIGGDHSLAMGSIAGVSSYFEQNNNDIGLLWFDAHADLNIPDITPSGNVHGMPLAHLLGYGDNDFRHIMGPKPKIKPENVVLIGVRDIDHAEAELLKRSGIKVFSMRDIDELGMGQVSTEAIDIVTRNTAGFHVSFDVDGCDPDVIPGSGTLVAGGVSFREAHLLLEKCADTELMVSMDMVELNPFLDNKNISAERAVNLIQSAFGHTII